MFEYDCFLLVLMQFNLFFPLYWFQEPTQAECSLAVETMCLAEEEDECIAEDEGDCPMEV